MKTSPELIEAMRLTNILRSRIEAAAGKPANDETWIAIARLAEAVSRTARAQVENRSAMPRQNRRRWQMAPVPMAEPV